MYYISSIAATLVLYSTLILAVEFPCKEDLVQISIEQGSLSVDRTNVTKCGYQLDGDFTGLAIRTDNLKLYPNEKLTVKASDTKKAPISISGPTDPGYLFFADKQMSIEFELDNNVTEKSPMIIEFIRKDTFPVKVERRTDLAIKSFNAQKYTLTSSTTAGQAHIQILGSVDTFGHHLIGTNITQIPVQVSGSATVNLKASPVRSDCSQDVKDEGEASHEITGPEASKIHEPYKCVNIFSTSMSGQAHYDVDFSNFLDIVDVDDELVLDDGVEPLKIARYSASYYSRRKPLISFRGQKLAVIYNSPEVSQPRAVFKLTVNAKANGGIIDKYQKLVLPMKGHVRFTLKSPFFNTSNALKIDGKLNGASLRIINSQGQTIDLKDTIHLPPIIALGDSGDDVNVELDINSKLTAVISYDKTDSCSGTLFDASGSISIVGGNKTCYWMIGSKSSINVNYNDLLPDGCLEIHSLDVEKPIFNKCNMDPTGVIPRFMMKPSYLKVILPSNQTRLEVSVSKSIETQVIAPVSSQETTITSIGYPSNYYYSSESSSYSLNAVNKSMILSIRDLDIRIGEKLIVNKMDIDSKNYLAIGDVDVSNAITNLIIQRSKNTDDFEIRRGYSLKSTTYQAIINAGSNTSTITIPKNLTSLLIKISSSQKQRLSYNISNANSSTYTMNLFDSRTIFGRQVYDEERLRGSTTSNMLLISLKVTKDKTFLPELKIDYKPIECNSISDHMCDNSTRCVPESKLCKGKSYCVDATDLSIPCTSGPTPQPRIIDRGISGMTVFFISMLMFALGVLAAIYGPDAYVYLDSRIRSGQYTTFTSTE